MNRTCPIRLNWSNAWRLKPFDESPDGPRLTAVQRTLWYPSLVVCAAMTSLIGVTLALGHGHPATSVHYSLLTAGSASVLGGVEWCAGLRARALNQWVIAALVLLIYSVAIGVART